MVPDMKDHAAIMLRMGIEYVIADSSEAELFGMVSLVMREAEKVAVVRKQKELQAAMESQQEMHRNQNMAMEQKSQLVGVR